ncbi:MAG: Asparagine synthetase [Eubacteriales bacterium SKADARSKE-1]|nr:Asparagine synthetase [Eubacteriales bacterium SKADARSKE-1]
MCGIAGIVDYRRDMSESSIIDKMSNSLKKRGPDDNGVYKDNNVCLIHRRLEVIDSENGKQPMTLYGDFGEYTIVYNGELYNTEEIRKELITAGYLFKGYSDTEVLLNSFIYWGTSCLQKLNGIFAFAIWDKREQHLFIARDRIGVKPLFFYQYNGGMVFGSEIKTLLSSNIVKPKVDEDGLREIFFLGPGRTAGQGIIKGIKELKPGEYAIFSEYGLKVKTYWSIKACEFEDSLKIAIEKTRFLVTNSIERQLVSDKPLCCLLSGGLDSSIISKVAANYYKQKEIGKITTYSVDYTDNQKYFQSNGYQPDSDATFINIMVDNIRSKHKNVVLPNGTLANALYDATLARDIPGMADIDSSLLLFCKEIKKDFTVALSGECADEIFGGYPWYHNNELLFSNSFPWSNSLEVRKNILRKDFLKNGEDYVNQKYLDSINHVDKLKSESKVNSRMREMFMLNINWFMQTLLDRKDRMSMYNGLEIRVPFCDYRIVEYAYNMPWEVKSFKGREKGILREAMKGILPESIVFRKKSPYPKTHNPAYMKAVSDRVKHILNDRTSLLSSMLDYDSVVNLIENDISSPWYGQLMRSPQIMAYIIQIDCWFKHYKIEII